MYIENNTWPSPPRLRVSNRKRGGSQPKCRFVLEPFSRREPSRAVGAELLHGPRLILRHVLRREGLCPAAVHPSIDEDLGTGVPEGAPEGNALGSVPLHPVKGAVL